MNGRSGSSNGNMRSRTEGNKVYVSNIDFNCSLQDLKESFSKVAEVAFVEMIKDDNQKPKGCAVIRFKQNNVANEAIRKMNRCELNGRKIVVKDASFMEREPPRDKMNRINKKRPREDDSFDRRNSHSSMNDYGNTYGLSMAFLDSLGIEGPLTNRVFVANLDYGVNEEMLQEVFGIAGKVLDIELVKDDEGKSKGYGFIEFEHPIEAVQAISMLHKQDYRDRQMSVQLTRKEKKKKDGTLKLPPGLRAVGMGLGVNGAPLKDVKVAIESGNQTSLLGAMPTNQNISHHVPMTNLDLGVMGGGGLAGNLPMGNRLPVGSMSNNNMGRGLMDQPIGIPSIPMGMNNPPNLRGLNNQSNQNFGGSFTTPSLTVTRNVIQINNLPNDYTWKDLQTLCTSFGDVTFAKITSRGVGAVQFENEDAARRAVDMLDNQRFEGSYLETRLL